MPDSKELGVFFIQQNSEKNSNMFYLAPIFKLALSSQSPIFVVGQRTVLSILSIH